MVYFFKQTWISFITGRQFNEVTKKNIINARTTVLVNSKLVNSKVLLISERMNFSKQLSDAK